MPITDPAQAAFSPHATRVRRPVRALRALSAHAPRHLRFFVPFGE